MTQEPRTWIETVSAIGPDRQEASLAATIDFSEPAVLMRIGPLDIDCVSGAVDMSRMDLQSPDEAAHEFWRAVLEIAKVYGFTVKDGDR